MRTRADDDGRITGDQAVDHQRLARPRRSSSSPARTASARARSSCARGAEGFRVTREEEKLGLNSSSTADLAFEDTPGERLGDAGGGHADRAAHARRRPHRHRRPGGRASRRRRSTSRPATRKERNAFGGPIGGFGAIQQKLADMQTEIEAARALTWRAARLKEAGRPHTRRGRAGEAVRQRASRRRQTGEAIQVLGGYGYTKEFPAERYYRDAKVTEIYEGTSEIQRLVIARALLGDAAR